jgi:DNA gyrase subunit A
MKRFALDAEQTDAILELKIYRLARLEILVITNELAEKRKRGRQIGGLLANEDSRWTIVRGELEAIQKTHGNPKTDPRRTRIEAAVADVEYSADHFIVEEDNVVILTRDGWVKRQKEVKDLSTTRLREGDQVMAVLAGSTRATAVLFTNFGAAYTCRIVDVPASTGYGEPIQRVFKFRDGERVVGAVSLDSRVTSGITPPAEGDPAPAHAVAVTTDGYALRFNLDAFLDPSTRAGRRYARPAEGAEVVGVSIVNGTETMIVATAQARAVLCPVDEINYLAGPGRGVILIKLTSEDDRVLGFVASRGDRDLLTVETSRGAEQTISTAKYEVTGRGGRGRELLQRGQFVRVVPAPPEIPQLEQL